MLALMSRETLWLIVSIVRLAILISGIPLIFGT
jgi:hypothetical protein